MGISENTGPEGGNAMCVGSSTCRGPVKPSVPQRAKSEWKRVREEGKREEERVNSRHTCSQAL